MICIHKWKHDIDEHIPVLMHAVNFLYDQAMRLYHSFLVVIYSPTEFLENIRSFVSA